VTVVEYDIEAAMRDGVVLRADVYRPAGPGAWPVLLVRTPYGKQDPVILGLLDPLKATRRGFLVVIQDVRGRFASDGEWEPFTAERADGHDTIAWAARLPGANGRVGTYGPSYLGQVQLAAQATNPPELVASVVAFTWADPADGLTARGGAAEWGLVTGWSLRQRFDLLRRTGAGPDRVDELIAVLDGFPGSAPADLRLPAVPVNRPTVPTMVVAGWYDPFLRGGLDTYAALGRAGLPRALIVGPWSHNNQSGHVGDVGFGLAADAAVLGLFDRQLDWLAGDRGEAEALVFVMGVNRWRRLERWPPESADQSWYLHADGRLAPVPPTDTDGADELAYDPADPVPTYGGPTLISPAFPPGPVDQRVVEDRADVLTYTSAPLETAVTVLGGVRAHLFRVTPPGASDSVVRLCDVGPDGVSRNVTDGILRSADTGELVVDLWSTAYVFQPGHRIRVQVTWSSFPRWDRARSDSAGGPARQRIRRDSAHPSRVVLSVPVAP
jgi:predicted acyl esterase